MRPGRPSRRPCARRVVADMPSGTLMAAAVAVDGAAAVRWLATMAGDAGPVWDAAVVESGLGAGLADLAPLIDGTWTLAVLPGAPFPELVLDAPRTPAWDERILALFARIPGWSAEGDGPWMTPLPGTPVMLSVAREPARWRIQVGGSGNAPAAGGLAIPATAAAWIAVDIPRIAQAAPGWISFASRDRLVLSQARAVATAARALGPQTFALARTGTDGVRLDAQGPMGLLATPTLAAVALPIIGQTREMALKAKTGNNVKQIVIMMFAYTADNDNQPPADLEAMIPWSKGDFPERLLHSAAGDRLGLPMPHFRYLRPRSDAGFKGTAAIVVEDPACNRGRGCIVGFGDGHYEWVPAPRSTALWAAIQERPLDHLWTLQESTTLPGLHE